MIDKSGAFSEFFNTDKKTVPLSTGNSLEEVFGRAKNPVINSSKNNVGQPLDIFGPDFGQPTEKSREISALLALYTSQKKEYMHHSITKKWEFIHNDPNEGYKFHLNVKPENVRAVSAFLQLKDFTHKYLMQDIDDGKVFAVYCGSKSQTEEIVKIVAESEIAHLLDQPKADQRGEVAYAPNIVGRFVGNENRYLTKVPRQGITVLREAERDNEQESFSKTNAALLADYGDYYGGGISYYEPKQ